MRLALLCMEGGEPGNEASSGVFCWAWHPFDQNISLHTLSLYTLAHNRTLQIFSDISYTMASCTENEVRRYGTHYAHSALVSACCLIEW